MRLRRNALRELRWILLPLLLYSRSSSFKVVDLSDTRLYETLRRIRLGGALCRVPGSKFRGWASGVANVEKRASPQEWEETESFIFRNATEWSAAPGSK